MPVRRRRRCRQVDDRLRQPPLHISEMPLIRGGCAVDVRGQLDPAQRAPSERGLGRPEPRRGVGQDGLVQPRGGSLAFSNRAYNRVPGQQVGRAIKGVARRGWRRDQRAQRPPVLARRPRHYLAWPARW